MLGTLINNLPAFVVYEGCTFQLILVVNEGYSATLAYIITGAVEGSKHYPLFIGSKKWKPIWNNEPTNYLCKESGITSEIAVRTAVHQTIQFLKTHGIYTHEKTRDIQRHRRSSLMGSASRKAKNQDHIFKT